MKDDESLRTDARENRERILKVARDALALDSGASLNSIAKTAGVGAGTLYRHFPNREALIMGVYRQEIEAVVALAPQLLAKHPPLRAFRRWCDRLAELGRIKHGVADIIDAAKSPEDFQQTYWPMLGAVRQLMDACEAAGEILPGAQAEDFLMVLSILWKIPPGPAGEERVQRILALVFRGLGAKD